VNYDLGSGEYFAFWVDSQHGKGASFLSEPLERERLMTGFPVVQLAISSDRPEPLVFAYLERVAPDGSAKVLAYGRLAAAYRQESKAPYDTLGLPWHGGLSADFAPLSAGQTARLRFALTPVAQVVPAGSRLRLVVTGADPRQRNLQEIRLDPPPLISVHTGRGGGSFIELPLAEALPSS
jgi:predicted acyl esterase